jgi:hypothetical protein
VRQQKSKPIVVEADRVLDESPIADAIRYARNQRVALARFLDDGRLPLHNNISERKLRHEVVGRRNWLFCGSDDGAETTTIFVSLLAGSSTSRPPTGPRPSPPPTSRSSSPPTSSAASSSASSNPPVRGPGVYPTRRRRLGRG